jgi:hypothetical protein
MRMPTLMGEKTFGELKRVWTELNAGPLAPSRDDNLAGICVPWAGSRLKKEGGIYYVGMATNGDYWTGHPQTREGCLKLAKGLCTNRTDHLARTPFWQFLDGLTWGLFGAPFHESAERWGWSNLLKIGWSVGNPNEWRPPVKPALINKQRDACVTSLREEFKKIRRSLIVVVSADTFGVLDAVLESRNWNKEYHEQTGIYSFSDSQGNLYVHGYHPRYLLGSPLGRTINLARTTLGFG